MRKMTLKEIQQMNLEMMKDIHAFCMKNNIRYSLAYGTLIGAIRHKGFIPWDDDIDIMMPRPDFERFSREYVSSTNRYRLSSVYDDDTFVNYTRVYDGNTLAVGLSMTSTEDIGVWIDVYPIDGISDKKEESEDQFERIRHYTKLLRVYRLALGRWKKGSLVKDKIKAVIRMIQLKLSEKTDYKDWHNRIIEICKETNFGQTGKCSSLVCVEANKKNRQEIFETSDFLDYQLVPFEDTQFSVISNYDRVLKTIFGDYMQIPPVEKRKSHSTFNYFWK